MNLSYLDIVSFNIRFLSFYEQCPIAVAYHAPNMKPILDGLNSDFEKIAPKLFALNPEAESTTHVSQVLREKYLANEQITEGNLRNLGKLFSDSLICHGVHRLVSLVRKHTNVYYFMFDVENAFTFILQSSHNPKLLSKYENSYYSMYVEAAA